LAPLVLGIVIPVYRNEQSIPSLLAALEDVAQSLRRSLQGEFEVTITFVIDGSPDQSESALQHLLPRASFRSQLVRHSRNFGSMAAVRTGLLHTTADHYAVIAADLQEPPQLVVEFAHMLWSGQCDVAVGVRSGRDDPVVSKLLSACFWRLYRSMVNPDFPAGGVDVFACSREVRNALVALPEANTSLIGQLYWLGFRRAEVPYRRQSRQHGKSAWTFARKISYMLDSVFAFTDLPIRALGVLGGACVVIGMIWAIAIVIGRLWGQIEVSGFSTLAVMMLLFGGVNAMGVSIAGIYAWRAYENSKGRPLAMTSHLQRFDGLALHDSQVGKPDLPAGHESHSV
jgi:glycosyltransferase involved in cell wall biosynthesis